MVGWTKQAKITDNYELRAVLGKGAYGEVVTGIDRATGERVAIKIINAKAVGSEDELMAIRSEVEVMQSLAHPQIVGFHSAITTENKMYIVMDLVTGGQLFDCIIARESFCESEVRALMQPLLSAVDHMHKRHVVHQDIKPENILLTDSSDLTSVKIADFGLAVRFNQGEEELLETPAGTVGFIAPEVIQGEVHGKPVDIWACGVIMYILVTGKHPFDGLDPATGEAMGPTDVFARILNSEKYINAPSYLTEECKEVLHLLLDPDPDMRATAGDVLHHHWFAMDTNAVPKHNMPDMISNMREFKEFRSSQVTLMTAFEFSAEHQKAAEELQRLARGHAVRREQRELAENAAVIQKYARGRKIRAGSDHVLADNMRLTHKDLLECFSVYRTTASAQMSLSQEMFLKVFRFNDREIGKQCFAAISLGQEQVDNFVSFAIASLLCDGTVEEKMRFVFRTFDFNGDRSLSMEELTIMVCVCERAIMILSGQKDPPVDRLESLTERAFETTGILEVADSAIEEDQFINWATNEKDVGEYFKRLRKARS